MRINQNVMAFNASRNLSTTNVSLGTSLEKLSSGFRINRAADDAAGLVISQGLRAQIGGLRQATRNAQDGVSVAQTAEGALDEVHTMLNRMRDLAVQAANAGANDLAARQANQAELVALRTEIDRIATSTTFGGVNLLDGTYGVDPSRPPITTPATFVGFAMPASLGFFSPLTGVWGISDPSNQFGINVAGSGSVVVIFGDTGGVTAAQLAAQLETSINAALGAVANPYADTFTVSAIFAPDPDPELATVQFIITSDALAHGETFEFSDSAGPFNMHFYLGLGHDSDTPASDIAGYNAGYTNPSRATAAVDPPELRPTDRMFQVGANANDTVSVSIASIRLSGYATGPMAELWDLDLTTDAADAIDAIDDAIAYVSEERGNLGALQNRFESMINNLSVTVENLTASESRIRDTDMAAEMVAFTRNQVLQQAGTAMLAQANQIPQTILSLLR